jgi:hypothetical protein
MKKDVQLRILTIIVLFVGLSLNLNSQNLMNYFSISEIKLANIVYQLSWSSHPNKGYYKHEYLPAGEKSASFKTMVLVEVIYSDLPLENAVHVKELELKERKKTDLVCNYQIMDNSQTGEYMIDFTVSSGNGETLDIVEWNVYRYKKVTDSKGNSLVLLFAMSKRAYADDIMPFLSGLKSNRIDWINLIGNYNLPTIEPKE